MTAFLDFVFGFFVWPGLILATVIGFFFSWFARKILARFQGRKGPPFYQPFFDFVKLLGKRAIVPAHANATLFYLLPFISLAATVFALMLLPLPGAFTASFPGDLILLLYLLEMPMLSDVLAGFVSRSIYGQVSAMREAVLSIAYSLPMLAGAIALAQAAGSFRLAELHAAPYGVVTVLAMIAFLLAIPARLKSNPFSIPNAEQEIGHGAHMEYSGAPLAVFELTHTLELVLIIGTFDILFLRSTGNIAIDAVLYLVTGLVLVTLIAFVRAASARFTVKHALKFYWRWGGLAAIAAMAVSIWA